MGVFRIAVSAIICIASLGCSRICDNWGASSGPFGNNCTRADLSSDAPWVSIQTPTLSRKMYVDDEVTKRTATISAIADQVSCSHDGGVTYGACDSANSVIWTVADYVGGKTIVVKASRQGFPDFTASFTPNLLYPGRSFVACTNQVTTSMSTTAFNALITGPTQVLCIANGVTITQPGAAVDSINILWNSTTIIAREGDTATVVNNFTSGVVTEQAGIYWTGVNNISIVGLSVVVSTAGPGIGALTSANLFIDGVTSTVTGNSGVALALSSTGGTSTTGTVRNSTFSVAGTGSSAAALTIINPVQSVTLDGCTLTNSSTSVATYVLQCVGAANKTILNSTLESTGTLGSQYVVNNAGPLVVQNSTLTGSNIFYHAPANSTWTATLDGNLLRKNSVAGSFYAITVTGSGTDIVNSTVANRFCTLGAPTFTSLIFNALDPGSTFIEANQYAGGAVGPCP